MFKIFKLVIIIITFILIKTETSYSSNSLIDVDKLELKISDDLGDEEILERTYLKSFNKLITKIVLSKDYPLAQSEATQDVIKDMVFSYKLKDSRNNDNINDQRDYVEVNYKYDISPIKPITTMSASVKRVIIPIKLLLPTPEPAINPILWPLPIVKKLLIAFTPTSRTSFIESLSIGLIAVPFKETEFSH